MLSLHTRLSTIGISAAKGVDLVMQRDQLKGTLPADEDGATSPSADTAKQRTAAAKPELTPAQQQRIEELKQIDRKVREHEQAHITVGRDLITSGPNYSYTYGPDGKQYATAGEVGIDTTAEKQPEDNIDKGQHIQATALAPKDPSPQDYRVAAVGARIEAQGYSDLAREQREQRTGEAEAAQRGAAAPERARVENAYAPAHGAAGSISVFA